MDLFIIIGATIVATRNYNKGRILIAIMVLIISFVTFKNFIKDLSDFGYFKQDKP